jgi:hypothetical protein
MSDESWAKEQKYKRVARVCVCTLTFLCVYPPLWFFLPYLATVLHAIFVLALVFIIFFGWVFGDLEFEDKSKPFQAYNERLRKHNKGEET